MLVAALLALAACGNSAKGPDCKTVLDKLKKLDLADWKGLPASCTAADVASVFPPVSDARRPFHLGSDHVAAEARTHDFDDDTALQSWLADGDVRLLEIEDPPLTGALDDLLAALGKPEATLEFAWDVLSLEGERVWPSRGITLFINPDNELLLRLAVYRPTTLEAYKKTLRVDRTVREFEPD